MKTERQVRELRDSLRALIPEPCDCDAQRHAKTCQIGGMIFVANEILLSWLLGENEEHQRMVDYLNEGAAEARARR